MADFQRPFIHAVEAALCSHQSALAQTKVAQPCLSAKGVTSAKQTKKGGLAAFNAPCGFCSGTRLKAPEDGVLP